MKRNIITRALSAALLVLSLTAVSCRREPIVYPVSKYYLSIDPVLEEGASEPKIYGVDFYDATGKRVYQSYIYSHNHPAGLPDGGYVNGIDPGQYTVLVYNYDASAVRVNNEHNLSYVFADTEVYSYSEGSPVIKMPDALYVWSAFVTVPYVAEDDPLYIIPTYPEVVTETWHLHIAGMKGLYKADAVNFYISGQAPGRWLRPEGTVTDGNAIILFAGHVPSRTKASTRADDDGWYNEDYMTFGRTSELDRIMLTVYVNGPGGQRFWAQVNITDKVEKAMEEGTNHIYITVELEVTDRVQGGFDPSAKEWNENKTEITLK